MSGERVERGGRARTSVPQLARQTQASCWPCMMVRTRMFTQDVVSAMAAALHRSFNRQSRESIESELITHHRVRIATRRIEAVNWRSRRGQTKREVRMRLTALCTK